MSQISVRNFRVFKWFSIFMGFRPIAPIAVLYYVHITGSYGYTTILFFIASVGAAILEIPTGLLSDYLGRKKTIILGTLAIVGAMLSYVIADSFLPLAIGAALEALAAALFSGNNDALLYESLQQDGKVDEFAHHFGKIRSLTQIAAALAALASGFIASIAFVLLAWISAISVTIALVISFFFTESRNHTDKIQTNIFKHLKEALVEFKNNIRLRDLSITSTLDWGLGGFANNFQPAFIALLWPVWAIGVVKSIENISYAISGWFAGKILKYTGSERWLYYTSYVRSVIGLISYGIPSVASPVLLAVEEALVAPIHAAQTDLMQKEFTERQRATMASLNSLAGNLFFGICSVIFGFLADHIGPTQALLASEVVLLPIIFYYYRIYKMRRT